MQNWAIQAKNTPLLVWNKSLLWNHPKSHVHNTLKKETPESQKSLEATLSAVQAGLSELKASFEQFKAQHTQEPQTRS